MFQRVINFANHAISSIKKARYAVPHSIGIKPIKYFIDSTLRDKVQPMEGSVLYCDLGVGAEHSGIYLKEGDIANIEVIGIAQGAVRRCNAKNFTSKSMLGKKIYVSCDHHGAVGHYNVADYAESRVGEKNFYGLLSENCHEFSRTCVEQVDEQTHFFKKIANRFMGLFYTEWESTIRALKREARNRLGATKWRLWDWENDQDEPAEEPDWQQQEQFFKNQALSPEFINFLRKQLEELQAYEQEIADENLPPQILAKLRGFGQQLEDVSNLYDKAKPLLDLNPDIPLSFNDLHNSHLNFTQLADELAKNKNIQELAKKLGRAYISETRKKQKQVPTTARSEVHGTHLSDDLMRLLPTELVNIEDPDLETLFYARLLEHNLQCYELNGTSSRNEEHDESINKRSGPVVACLDTSGSMQGDPLMKAQALLFAIAGILKKEQRSLHVLLFGDHGQLAEYAMTQPEQMAGLLKFLQQQFNGGTDFVTPLKRACEIIELEKSYQKADILMISDGDCQLNAEFEAQFKQKKTALDCSVYSVLCNGQRTEDRFSDEVLVL